MESQSWRKEPRKIYSNDFKLRIVELASRPDACIAQIARENGLNNNIIFKWLRLWQKESRVSRRLPATINTSTSPTLLPVKGHDLTKWVWQNESERHPENTQNITLTQ